MTEEERAKAYVARCLAELVKSTGFIPRLPGPYIAQSASDKDPDWPIWYVAGSDGRTNVLTHPKDHPRYGAVLTEKTLATAIAYVWNNT